MKRDMDLIRSLLLFIEKDAVGGSMYYYRYVDLADQFSIDSHTILGHIRLLAGAGFIENFTLSISRFDFSGLSWQGHDFLDSIRDTEIWKQTKEAASKAGGFTVELLAEIAKGLISTKIKKHTGVEI